MIAASAFAIVTAVASVIVIAIAASTAAVARLPRHGMPTTPLAADRSRADGPCLDPGVAAVLPAPQDVAVLRRQCPEDRLQGRAAAAALRLRARQDRAQPHHRGLGQEATRARARDKARALSRIAALCD